MPAFAVLYDPRAAQWLRFDHPLEEIEVHEPVKVLPALEYLEQRVETEGLFAAGLVSYEAAPAFDDALQAHASSDFPLLRFGIFARAEQIDLPAPEERPGDLDWQAMETPRGFADKVDAIRAAIARGETYQVNLTFALESDFHGEPWEFFLNLVHGQKAQGAGFMQWDRWAICSVSPELFFARNADRLTMRPMKGTAPRGRTLDEDQRYAEELRVSAKNRAENIMILDMVRNDLGRLAPPGEVRTEAICTLERYPTIWQLTSTASARSEASLAEMFKALFPCASITGAPKARTMQIIATTENSPRRMYTGAFGWLAPGSQARFNVAIRTALIDRHNRRASYGVGAGITWDSDSGEEYRECLDKAAVLTHPKIDFALLETLLWAPGKGFFLRHEHLTRLQDSADYFDFRYEPEKITRYLGQLAAAFASAPQRVRLLLHRGGQLSATVQVIEARRSHPLRLCLAEAPVNSKDPRLYHKTTQREVYDRFLARAGDADEVVLWNERGEVTECCTANLVLEIDGQLVTPPLSSGLLPGTYRGYLLGKGVIRERVVRKDELQSSPRIYLVNAVRKWRRANLD